MTSDPPTPDYSNPPVTEWLRGQRIAVRGKLGGMNLRELRAMLAKHGAALGDAADPAATLVVVSEAAWTAGGGESLASTLDEPLRTLVRTRQAELIAETEFFQRLGVFDSESGAGNVGSGEVQKLYTPAMLASLLGVSVSSVRTWQRHGLLVPVHRVRKLPYFDFVQVTAARRLAELTAAGLKSGGILRRVAAIAGRFPEVAAPLGELPLVVSGNQLLLRQGESLVDVAGQFRIDFDATNESHGGGASEIPRDGVLRAAFAGDDPACSPAALFDTAAELEEQGDLPGAIEACRAALVAGGATAPGCFQLAELLYRQSDLPAARERYYMAIELDEDFVEARANLGCILAETGQTELAIAALEGALACHASYADVHYHLARALDDAHRTTDAVEHWRQFVDLAPDSPWADEARERLAE